VQHTQLLLQLLNRTSRQLSHMTCTICPVAACFMHSVFEVELLTLYLA
jgi:hypothetical protein